MRLVLASKSPARLATLKAAGVTPVVIVSDVDEDAVTDALYAAPEPPTPAEEVSALARAKAEAVVADLEGHGPHDLAATRREALEELGGQDLLVVGCDSMLHINGRMVGKPHTPDVAAERIREMRNGEAVLWTGHHLHRLSPAGAGWRAEDSTTRSAQTLVRFGDMTDEEIDAYVATGEPLNVAGSFTIDALGGPFVEGVDGDPHSVVGISLPLLRHMGRDLGVFWPDLWDSMRTA